jgi:hypothetical protein
MFTRATLSFLVLISIASTSCATSFTGDAHVPGGPAGCVEKCRSWNLDFAGMVAMGEYSDGCICRVRQTAGPAASNETNDQSGAIAGAGAAAAGVVTAMRAAQQRQQQMQAH